MTYARSPRHVAFYLDHLRGGGVQKMRLIIAREMIARGHQVDLVVCQAEGPLLAQVPEQARLVPLATESLVTAGRRFLSSDQRGWGSLLNSLMVLSRVSPTLTYFPSLVKYLNDARPYALYAATPPMNIEAALAKRLARVPTRVIVSEHNTLVPGHPLTRGLNRLYLPVLLNRAYKSVDAVVAVSHGVADDINDRTGLPKDQIHTIYNPCVTPELTDRAKETLDHPWFGPDQPPVILGAGRLSKAKDFPNLIQAFAKVRRRHPVRLMILGEAKHPRKTEKRRAQLTAMAEALGISEDLALPGFAQNPYKYMANAGVFALSSVYEGLPNVLIEALACGCPVVSTDCPSGPMEILDHGKYGALVPTSNPAALADAIISVLEQPPSPELLHERAKHFTVDKSVDHYESLLFDV